MVSVIVPIYNVETYLRQCIESICDQTYPDLEIILIDDGSTDGSGIIADSYTDHRIRIFHTKNHGLSAARNLGIDNAHGEFLLFIDSDDWIEPDLIETAVTNIGSADILCFGYNDTHYRQATLNGPEALNALF